jgi:DNA-binding phage protein
MWVDSSREPECTGEEPVTSANSHISSRQTTLVRAIYHYMRFDYAKIASEFLRAIRGRRSQAAFSRRLGYRTNVLYLWEAGRSFPTAADALTAAARAGINVRDALTNFFHRTPDWLEQGDPTTRQGVAALLNDLRGRTGISELAKATGKSRFALARWLRGDAEPKLPEFFLLIEKTSLRLLDFIACLVDPKLLPTVAHAWDELESTRRAAFDMPWTQAVLRTLELRDYADLERHVPGWIAKRVGLTQKEEQQCLQLLARTHQITFRQGRWQLREVMSIDTRRDPAAERQVKRWWTELALDRLGAGTPGIFSYNVFAVSEKDLATINDLYRAYFRQIRAIIAQSEPSERVVVASMQLVPLDVMGPQLPSSARPTFPEHRVPS